MKPEIMANKHGAGNEEDDESDEDTTDEEREDLMDDFEAELERENRIRELKAKKRKLMLEALERKTAHETFVRFAKREWNSVTRPVPCAELSSSEEEDNDKERNQTTEIRSDSPVTETNPTSNDQLPSTSTSSSSIQCDKEDNLDQPGEKTKDSCTNHPDAAAGNAKLFKEATAKLMLRYALKRSEFHEEIRRQRESFPSTPETIEKLAFFKYFQQTNRENTRKLDEYKKWRLEEWKQFKEQKKKEMAEKPITDESITELKEFLKAEKSKRTKEDKKKWRKDQRALRSFYLEGEEDYRFQEGNERPIDRNNSSN